MIKNERTKNGRYNKFTIVCLIVCGLMIYSKYFVETTELGKMGAGISSMLWIILGMIFLLFDEINKLKRSKLEK